MPSKFQKIWLGQIKLLPIFGDLDIKKIQMKNTSISLGIYFDQFVSSQVSTGRYKNVSEVIRAALRLLEDEENKEFEKVNFEGEFVFNKS
jgi:putative addiction module CopG family antidote